MFSVSTPSFNTSLQTLWKFPTNLYFLNPCKPFRSVMRGHVAQQTEQSNRFNVPRTYSILIFGNNVRTVDLYLIRSHGMQLSVSYVCWCVKQATALPEFTEQQSTCMIQSIKTRVHALYFCLQLSQFLFDFNSFCTVGILNKYCTTIYNLLT